MRFATFGFKAIRRLRYLLETPSTALEVRHEGLDLRARTTLGERSVLLELRHFLDGQDLTVYDIGASHGSYTSALAKLGNVGRVVAFEPLPDVFADLQRRVAGLPNVACFNLALGDESGTTTFYRSAFSYSSSLLLMEPLHKAMFPQSAESTAIPVRVDQLDELAEREKLPMPDFVKIDVQGAEDRVLKGGSKTIRKARYCMLEMSYCRLYQNSPLFDDIYCQMRALGFSLVGVVDQVRGVTGKPLQADGIFHRDGG
jgi:FkbM family methyltransferase